MEVTIETKKKLIMDFMGVKPVMCSPDNYGWADQPFYSCRYDTPEKVVEAVSRYIKYDTDWNLLHGVIDKIESIVLEDDNSFKVTIGATNYCVIRDSYGELCVVSVTSKTKILSVFDTIYEFLIGYMESK